MPVNGQWDLLNRRREPAGAKITVARKQTQWDFGQKLCLYITHPHWVLASCRKIRVQQYAWIPSTILRSNPAKQATFFKTDP